MAGATIVYSTKELEIRQIKSDEAVSEQMYDWLCGLAKEWGVHVRNIALLGGKPYPMQGALFQMFDSKREKEKLIVAGWETKSVHRATQQDIRSGSECTITLFDKGSFDDAVKKIAKENVTVEMIEKLHKTFTYQYRDEGWASIQTVRMPAMQNIDYIQHMSSTRSIDRTLRLIVRCPYTAASELSDGTPDGSVTVQQTAGLPGPAPQPPTDGSGVVLLSRPKQKEPESGVKVETKVAAPVEAPKPSEISPPVDITLDKKDEKINEKQIAALAGRWGEYVKSRMTGLKGPQIEAKLDRLVKALYGYTSRKDVTVAQLSELLTFMERGDIEIGEEEAPKDEVAVSKPANT